ncbi:TRAP transporter large permease [Halanaerobium praevalens]|uniref:TRAP dicarboxylate transporter, DctM subunit n=1 Tax=Halanaerobium praevalens (strain ATCC 33744 / DSM 2228 / GSL) TaxID=572479 RepID=E3DLL6_HALPG|nr:TRAP transporter large permease [Halanaerobium praevalens]ADO76196.1 TRAP dicarboxylate transporter, DctM subunit [Halanaerobium praevalens DSM 2228]
MAFVPVIIAFILYFTGIPIAFALIAAALSYFSFINVGMPPDLILQRFVSSSASFPMLAIPFFIMAGSIMNYSGISASLMKMADVLTGHLTGGLAQVNIVLSLLMGGISGSANADAAMQCKILVPEMEKRGYSRAFSTAVTAASSSVAPVIPPGIDLIIYALIAQVSVGKMFLAGYAPAIIMGLTLMVTVSIIAKKRNYAPSRAKRASLKEIFTQARKSIWALFLPFGIILGLRAGMFTPTEGGAIAVLFCTLVGIFVYKELELKHLPLILKDTIYSTSTVMFIIIAASIFGYYMTWEMIPQALSAALLSATNSKILMLLMVNLLLLILGMFLEGGAALIILAPLLVPVVTGLGVDPVHFGAIAIVNIMIGGITPPFGSMMFTSCSITGVEISDFVKEVYPFILALIVALLVVTYVPGIVMFLPNLF